VDLKKFDFKEVKELGGINLSFLSYLLSNSEFEKLCVIFPEETKAEEFKEAFKVFNQNQSIVLLPEKELPPFSDVVVASSVEGDRISALWRFKEARVITGSVRAFLEKLPPISAIKEAYIYLIPSETINREEFVEKLVSLGYERVGVVREKGSFTVKGGIIDVWSPQEEFPVRIELFGNEVMSLRHFSPETQKSVKPCEETIILPAKEAFFPEDIKSCYEKVFAFKNRVSEKRLKEVLIQLETKVLKEASDFFLPVLFERLISGLEALPEGTVVLLYEPERILKEVEKFESTLYLSARKAKEREKLFFSESKVYLSSEDLKSLLQKFHTINLRELPSAEEEKAVIFDIKIRDEFQPGSGVGRVEAGFNALKEALKRGEKVLLVVSDEKVEKLVVEGLKARQVEDLKNLEFRYGFLKEGFFLPLENLWVTSEAEIFGKSSVKKKTSGVRKARGHFRNFEDLKPGDYVVHKVHGIGRYKGLTVLELGGVKGEFLEIEYQDGDKLFLPVARLDELYPYVGVEDKEPKLDKLGRQTFVKRRKKVEKELKEVVEELLALYAERKTLRSYSISFPALAYQEFSATFPFEETEDQKTAIEEVISDLCSPKAMERLLVGDVGFGKTEVALRAAFLVAYSGKQVAFLVPTTILAEQHYRNFKNRLEAFGIKVGVLSRLRSDKEQKETLKALAEGELKVVIGTHRLLSPDVRFKDLGLLVIDEEHRFGVKQKEKIKQLKKSVKVLTLSATPIPRSLQLSLLGIFDLSVIETPPPGRKPVKTVLAKFEPGIIKHAIETELERGGQVFFVNPRIHGLASLAGYIKKLVPQARVEIIHGRMPTDVIEKNLYAFLEKKVDVLVSTAIVGSGIDIPTVNTIVINRADMFGLADIYQLRGRVGRADIPGYAYLLVPSIKHLSEEASRRLKAVLRHSDLGSGFKLAMSDLKIRGAGELLGLKQSGHINTVGYELYLELLENTIKALKGEKVEDWEPEVNIRVSAYIPQSYIPEVRERLSIYRELVVAKTLEELEEVKALLEDKYGPLPEEVLNLIEIFRLKKLMKSLEITFVESKGFELIFFVKDKKLLPRFRKFAKDYKVFVKHADTVVRITFKGVKTPLKTTIKICENLAA